MRGADRQQGALFSVVSLEDRVPREHPLRVMRALVDEVIADGTQIMIVAEIAHRTSILPMVLNGLGRAVMPSAWTESARRAGAHVQRIVPESYLHVAAVSRTRHLTAPAAALMDEARRYGTGVRRRPGRT